MHADLSHPCRAAARPCALPWACICPLTLFPLSWAWTAPMALPTRSSHHPHRGCRRSWRTCWMPRRSCGTWMSSRPWPCCCLRAPAQAGLLGPQPAALVGRPTALGLGRAPAPTARPRRGPRPLQPRPPRKRCRASAPPSCSSGPACSPSCVATTGRWVAGVRKAGGAGPAPRPGSDAPSLVPAHGPPLPANGLLPAPAWKPLAHPSLPVPCPTSLACLPQHHRARGAAKGQHELPGLHEQGAAEPGPPRAPHDQQPQDPVRTRGLRGRPCHSQGLHLGLPVSSGAGTEGAGQRVLQAGDVSGGAVGGRIGRRWVQPWLLRTPGLGSLGKGTCEQVLGAGAL